MRHVREILRLSLEAGLSTRVVGERIGVGSTTVRDTLKRFTRAKLIPRFTDQNSWAHWRWPMDMIFQGCSTSLFQAKQQ